MMMKTTRTLRKRFLYLLHYSLFLLLPGLRFEYNLVRGGGHYLCRADVMINLL